MIIVFITNCSFVFLVAIREDRTRGGRSTYQCSYTLPANLVPPGGETSKALSSLNPSGDPQVKLEAPDLGAVAGSSGIGNGVDKLAVPQLLQVRKENKSNQ